jgi:hypothetical protein
VSDNPAPPSDPQEAEPGPADGEPGGGSAPEAVAAQANAVTRRTLTALVALLFAFGSCGIAYGVFRVAGGDGGGDGDPGHRPRVAQRQRFAEPGSKPERHARRPERTAGPTSS